MQEEKNSKRFIMTLIFVTSMSSVNAVLFTPALPRLTTYINITKAQSQYTISVFLVGYALSQIFFGFLANYLGKRKALLLGLNLGVAASILCIISLLIKNYHLLLLSRFLVGFGTAAGLIIAYATVNEIYSGRKAKKVMSYMIMAFAITPGIANLIGGYLTKLNPLYCFAFLLLCNLIILILAMKYFIIKNNTVFNIGHFSKEYLNAFIDRRIILPGIVYGSFTGILYTIVAMLPFIVIEKMNFTPQAFGTLFCITYLGYLLGSITVPSLSQKLSSYQSILLGITLSIASETILIIFYNTNLICPFVLFFCIFLILFSLPFVFINASVLGLSNHPNKSTASSIFNFINVGIAFLTVFCCGMIRENLLKNMDYFLITLTLMALCTCIISAINKIGYAPINNRETTISN
jgi:MFS family permease